VDPVETVDGANLYLYVLNNPLNWMDLFGLQIVRCGSVEGQIELYQEKKNKGEALLKLLNYEKQKRGLRIIGSAVAWQGIETAGSLILLAGFEEFLSVGIPREKKRDWLDSDP
jgi:hypothetical protein